MSWSSKNERPSGGSGHRDSPGGECSQAHNTITWPLWERVQNFRSNFGISIRKLKIWQKSIFCRKLKIWQKSIFCSKIENLTKLIFLSKSEYLAKIDFFVEKWKFGKRSKVLWKIEISNLESKISNLESKISISIKNRNFVKRSKLFSKIETLAKIYFFKYRELHTILILLEIFGKNCSFH